MHDDCLEISWEGVATGKHGGTSGAMTYNIAFSLSGVSSGPSTAFQIV